MKNKLFIPVLLTVFAFVACQQEIEVNRGDIEVPKGKRAVTVTFPGKTATPTTYATSAVNKEKSLLGGVRVYTFSDDNGQPGKVLDSDEVKFSTPLTGSEDTEGAGVQGTFLVPDVSGKFHLMAVANNKEQVVPVDATYEDFKNFIVTKMPGIDNQFVMATTAPVTVTLSKGGNPPAVTFLLERLAARVDVINNAKTPGKEFVMTRAGLQQRFVHSRLMLGDNPGVSQSMERANSLWADAVGDEVKAALYTYENHNLQLAPPQLGERLGEITYLVVEGTMNGTPVGFEIYFGEKLVKRNTLYLVVLKNVLGDNQVEFDIVVQDWVDGGVQTLTPDYKAMPFITSITGDFTGDNSTTAINLPNTRSEMLFNLESPSAQSEIVAVDDAGNTILWVSATDITTYGNAMKQTIRVTVGKNPEITPRVTNLLIRNKLYPTNEFTKKIVLTQAAGTGEFSAAEYPLLIRLATANVDNLNTFTALNPLTEGTVGTLPAMGKLYQFGRNVGFAVNLAEHELSFVEELLPLNDPRVWQEGTYVRPTGTHSWYTPSVVSDTWESVVQATTGAPASYVGNNGGDPCPQGWRLPTEDEMRAMFPIRLAGDVETFNRFNGNVDMRNMAETIGGTAYTADYYSKEEGVLYALKLKGGDNSRATAYRYQRKQNAVTGYLYLKVTGRLLGNEVTTTTVEQIANAAYWATGTQDDVVRLFPAASRAYYSIPPFPSPFNGHAAQYHVNGSASAQVNTILSFTVNNIYVNQAKGKTVSDAIRCIRK